MPKVKISEYSTTNSNNTDINSINIDEGCAPSGINNAIREVMVHLKNWQTNASGDGATFASLVVQGTGSFTGAVTMSAGATLSGTNTLSGSTVMAASAGTSASPSIYFSGDTNTGIFSPAADTIAFAEGGAEAMRIDSSGRVGIGETNPTNALQVKRTSGASIIKTQTTDTASYSSLDAQSDSGSGTLYRFGSTYSTSGQYIASSTLLESSAGSLNLSSANAEVRLHTGNSERMRIDSSGNVGIGTSSPAYKLDVTGGLIQNTNTTSACQFRASNTGGLLALVKDSSTGGSMGIGAYSSNLYSDGAYPLAFWTNGSERARINSDGFLLVRVTTSAGWGTAHRINRTVAQGNAILSVDNNTEYSGWFLAVDGGGYNAADCALKTGRHSSNLRSINAGGTINASGADYAEYMTKAGDFVIAKGDICGVNAEGKLTNVFADAIAFVVKSTDPSYVGGDVWGNEDAVGKKPREIEQRVAQFDEDGNEIQPAETDEEFATRQSQYQSELAAWESKFEAERQKVDRIAFSGQVPVNVTGAIPGQYIVPVESNGGISAIAVNEADMTMAQYVKSVGKVIAIQADGKAKIIVKVA